jgi:hypothetical protein
MIPCSPLRAVKIYYGCDIFICKSVSLMLSRLQVLRELPALKTMSTRDIVKLSSFCTTERFIRGQQILQAGSHVDKVIVRVLLNNSDAL